MVLVIIKVTRPEQPTTPMQMSIVKTRLLEHLIINWALLPDAVFYSLRSKIKRDRYVDQTFPDRCVAMWRGRVTRYHKLLRILQEHGGVPPKVERLCKKSLCATTRLTMARVRLRRERGRV